MIGDFKSVGTAAVRTGYPAARKKELASPEDGHSGIHSTEVFTPSESPWAGGQGVSAPRRSASELWRLNSASADHLASTTVPFGSLAFSPEVLAAVKHSKADLPNTTSTEHRPSLSVDNEGPPIRQEASQVLTSGLKASSAPLDGFSSRNTVSLYGAEQVANLIPKELAEGVVDLGGDATRPLAYFLVDPQAQTVTPAGGSTADLAQLDPTKAVGDPDSHIGNLLLGSWASAPGDGIWPVDNKLQEPPLNVSNQPLDGFQPGVSLYSDVEVPPLIPDGLERELHNLLSGQNGTSGSKAP